MYQNIYDFLGEKLKIIKFLLMLGILLASTDNLTCFFGLSLDL